MKDKGKKIAVLGGGASGVAAARLALAGGALVRVFDTAEASRVSDTCHELELLGIEMCCGQEALNAPADLDLIVLSPGIDQATPLVRNFLASGVSMISEIEFAFQRDERPVIAITGTNGKTTTTELVAHLLNSNGKRAVAAGNYGKPYSEVALEPGSWDVVVLEVSSFQLEQIDSFRPEVSVWMNFAADHMDRYRTLDDYRNAKLRIFENQTSQDTAVVKVEDAPQGVKAKQIQFSAFSECGDFSYEGREIFYHGVALMDFKSTKLHGRHNAENVMAAMAATSVFGLAFDCMIDALADYTPPAHRYEKVAEINGVTFINDSKATNLHALQSSLRGQEGKLVLIVGGKNKGLDYGELTTMVQAKVSRVIAIGEMADTILGVWERQVSCMKAESLQQAVDLAVESAKSGQVILFSPGT